MKQFYENGKIEVGLDEVGRGCLFGPVCVSGVVWLDDDPIKDDKDYIECYRTWDNYNKKRIKECKDDICFFNRY